MAKSRSSKRKTRALGTIQEKGFALCALGLGMLIVPLFMGKSPMMAALVGGLRPAGWFALVAGAVLLIVHHAVKIKVAKTEFPLQPEPTAPQTRHAASSWSPAVFAAIEWRRFESIWHKLKRLIKIV